MNARLEGGCQVPIGSYATLQDDTIHLTGLVGTADGATILYANAQGHRDNAEQIGIEVAESLLAQGAGDILAALHND